MTVRVTARRRVVCRAVVPLPLTARQAWGQLRDFHRYAAHDHFHAGFLIEGGVPQAGARLTIEHRYGPFRTRRVGRILRWREGEGFAFSDLSIGDARRAFPHVLRMSVGPTSEATCALTIAVTGRWTAPTPRWIARLWLAWVFLQIVQKTRNGLLLFAATSQRPGAPQIRS
ncbi:MAG: hypothetical protein JWM57_3441 [Phycisphaerales bacterium]|nr:hypothetical protein [Phycisphaerales bacterium]